MSKNLEEEAAVIVPPTFPAGVKVVISISGLAYCKLRPNLSEINFIRHQKQHRLKIGIYEVNLSAPVILVNTILSPTEIPENEGPISIDVLGSRSPGTINQPSAPQPLTRMIFLSKVHNPALPASVTFDRKTPPGGKHPTLLTITNSTFGTLRLTDKLYQALRPPIPVPDPPTGFERIGDILGGYINSSTDADDTKVVCSILGPEGFRLLPGVRDGIKLGYYIEFTNHCVEPAVCDKEVRDHNSRARTDFYFYYDVLEHRGSTDTRFELVMQGGGGGGDTVAACNAVIIEPSTFP